MNRIVRRYLTMGLCCSAAWLALPALPAGQEPPPVTGTIALEGTVDKTYKAANTVLVKTTDGIRHLFHLTGRTAVHGGALTGAEAFRGLEAGSTVVVHYTSDAGRWTALEVDRLDDRGLTKIEGVVTRVDRAGRKLSIRLEDGSQQTLRLTDHAATHVGKDVDSAGTDMARVVVYYTDDAGQRVAHYFKRIG